VGIRPGDLVGAIANETGLAGRDIGPIRITERFSVVGVPAQSVNTVIAALKSTAIKGRRPNVRPYTD
jgi:ATP-dependent RNA helicase DeaD